MLLTGLVGRPVTHSIGQTVYNRFFSLSGIASMYISIDLTEENLPVFVSGSKDSFLGYNVTIPHKVSIMKFLENVDGVARDIGAVNLVKNSGGKSMGYNTDYYAAMRMFSGNGISLKGKSVAIAGSGGVARTIIYHILEMEEDTSITVISRNPETAEDKLSDLTAGRNVIFTKSSAHGVYDILINCTPVGMWPHGEGVPFSSDVIVNCEAGIDLVYNPMETMFARELERRGKIAVRGSEFFMDQGLESLRILFDREIDEASFRKVAKGVIGEMKNG